MRRFKDKVPVAQRATETRRKPYKLSQAQVLLGIHLKELGLTVEYEHKFTERGWRFDLWIPEARIGIECNGGHFLSRGHRSYRDLDREYEKLNRAAMMGVRVLQFTNEFVLSGQAKEFVKEWL